MLCTRKKFKPVTTDSGHGYRVYPNILDIFSRKCVGWRLSRSIDAQLTLLNGLIHHSDRGIQYASSEYVECLKHFDISISMSRKGNVYDNAFAESFMKTLKNEEVDMNEYETFEDAYQKGCIHQLGMCLRMNLKRRF